VTQSRRNASRGAQRGALLASDHGNEMHYSGMGATQSVMGDNLESAPAVVVAPERSAPQPFYTRQQQPLSGRLGVNSKNHGRISIRAAMTATRR